MPMHRVPVTTDPSSPDTARPATGPVGPGQNRPGNLSGPLAHLDGECGLPPQHRVPDLVGRLGSDRPGGGQGTVGTVAELAQQVSDVLLENLGHGPAGDASPVLVEHDVD